MVGKETGYCFDIEAHSESSVRFRMIAVYDVTTIDHRSANGVK